MAAGPLVALRGDGDGTGQAGDALCRVCAGRGLHALAARPNDAAPARLRVGGPVRHGRGPDVAGVVPVPLCAAGRRARGRTLGGTPRRPRRSAPPARAGPGAPAMSPAHRTSQHRWRVVAVVVIVIAGVGVLAATYGAATPQSLATPASQVSSPDAESSAWYCAGQGTSANAASGQILLTNTTGRAVAGNVTTVSDAGAAVRTAVAIPPHSVVSPTLQAPLSGSWVSDIVTLAGGGVAVTQAVAGPSGWSIAPCQSATSAAWYFPGGTTSSGAGLGISLLNPTTTPVVVDLRFVTPSGVVHPLNYQGVVLQPGQLVIKDVESEVQNDSTVSTVVAARTGRFVAAQLQLFPAPTAGLSLVTGFARPESHWVIPQSQETQGGSSEIDVLNPGTTSESVTVQLRLPSGPLAPLSSTVAPDSTWVLVTSGETRIPVGASYSADIEASGGPGVVVGRTVRVAA